MTSGKHSGVPRFFGPQKLFDIVTQRHTDYLMFSDNTALSDGCDALFTIDTNKTFDDDDDDDEAVR